MAHVRTKYIVYNHSGTGVRHHHFTSSNYITGATDDNYPGTTDAATGTHTSNGWATLPYNGDNLPFAFMSVHGSPDGNHLYTTPGNQTFPVGTADIDVLVVYAPPGGIGSGGGPGIWVDAFNVDIGDFSDDLHFITILTPPTPPDTVDAPKTTFANQEGEVSSLTAEHIRASHTVDAGAPFVEWKKICPVAFEQTSPDFDLAQNQTGEIWFAFYQTVPPSRGIPKIRDFLAYAVGKWVDDDYCGTPYPHHIGPGGPPFRINVDDKAMKSLPAAQQKELQDLSKEYTGIAQAGYAAMTKVIAVLDKIGSIVAKGKAQ
jgi:hypothetical protein